MSRHLRLTEEQFRDLQLRVKIENGARKLVQQQKKRNKFNAKRVEVDGIMFDSKHEAERYRLLKQSQERGFIRNLRLHVPLACEVNGVLVTTLLVDFAYERDNEAPFTPEQKRAPSTHFEDSKGLKRGASYALFKLKQKLVEACLGIKIEEV